MAETAPLKEYTDGPDEYARKMSRLLSLMREAKLITAYTGAGVSTTAGIPDIRGEHGLETKQTPLVVLGLKEQDMDCTLPTYTHCALTELVRRGVVRFVATSNHDGLHQKSGLADECIADVFGNVFVEKCLKCKRLWKRSVVVPSLGRRCEDPGCKGRLQKTGTRMGEATPEEPLQRAWQIAKKSDLAIVLGSSLTVSPFCQLPFLAAKTVILNLQDTAYGDRAALNIHCYCDRAMRDICQAYAIEMNQFKFCRKFCLVCDLFGDKCSLLVTGDAANEPSGVVASVGVAYSRAGTKLCKEMEASLNGDFVLEIDNVASGSSMLFTFYFRDNYLVPPLEENIILQEGNNRKELEFSKCIHF